MADLLPDIPSDVWQNWSADQFAQAAQEKIAGLGGDISTGVQNALAPPPEPAPAPPPPPPPEPEPAPPPEAPPPEPEPAPPPPEAPPAPPPPPAPDLSAPPPDLSTPGPATPDTAPAPSDVPPPDLSTPAPAPADTAPAPAPPTPTPAPASTSTGGWDMGALLGAADQAGADMGQFTSNLGQSMSGAGSNMVGAALGAAEAAGANMGQFAGQLGSLVPQQVTAAATGVAGAVQAPGQAAQSLGIQGPTAKTPGDLIDQTRQAAIAAGIDPDIFARQINQESGFNPQAGSSAGAQGIAQFMPGTAKQYGVDPWNPQSALPGAAKMMSNLLNQYGGDWNQALAAYNGGSGAVQQLNAGTPWGETKSYLNSILGGAKNVVQGAADSGVQAVNNVGQAAQSAVARTSQFAMGLSSGDAMAFCGPAAAMAFAQTFGRNPTVDEAKQLASQVGWNAGQGMAGVGSEVSLLKNLGVDAHSTSGVDWSQVAKDASSGNPVIIDTPGHYFYVDGYNQDTGQFHFGSSATDLKASGGKEWFTPDQMNSLGMGAARSAIYADHPLSGPGAAAQQAVGSAQQAGSDLLSSAQGFIGDVGGQAAQKAQDTMSAVLQTGLDTVQSTVGSGASSLNSSMSKVQSAIPPDLGQPINDAVSGIQQSNQADQQWLQQHPDVAASIGATGTPLDMSKPLGPQLTGFDPYGQIVQQGIPSIISGVQQGNVGDVLGGLWQTGSGAMSVLPGSGGLGSEVAGPVLSKALELADVIKPPDVAAASTAFGAGGQPAATGAEQLQRVLTEDLSQYPEELAGPIRDWATSGSAPASDVVKTVRQWIAANPAGAAGAAPAAAGGAAGAAEPAAVTAQDVLQAAQQQGGSALENLQKVAPEDLNSAFQDVSDALNGKTATPAGEEAPTPATGTPTGSTAAPPAPPPGGGTPTPPPGGGGGTPTPTTPIPTPTGGGGTPTPPTPPTGGGGGGGGTPPPGTATPTPATGGNIFSNFGQWIASAMSPTQNLPAVTRNVIEDYANTVGRNSNAAEVIANSDSLRAGGLTPSGIELIRNGLRDSATTQLVTDLRAQGLAAPRTSAPSNFRLATDAAHGTLSNWAFDPSVVGPIRNVTQLSGLAGNPVGGALLKATGTAKSTLFALSNFHTMTEGLNAAFSSPETLNNYAKAFVSNDFAQTARTTMASTFDNAAKAGVTGLTGLQPDVGTTIGNTLWRRVTSSGVGSAGGAAAGYTEAKIAGKSDDEARNQAIEGAIAGGALGGIPLGGRGTVSEILNSALWDRAVPMAKATAWDGLVKGGLDAKTAADVINQRFGGLNYAAMGRNPALVDASKLLVQAPDWNESTVRQLGSTLFGGSGAGANRAFLAKSLAGMMATTEVANYAMSGHGTDQNQPGHQFEIEMSNPSGGYTHIGILPGNIQSWLNEGNKLYSDDSAKRASDLTNFGTSRLGAVPQLLAEGAQTATAGGNALREPYAVSKAGPVGLGESLSPIGIQQVFQGVDQGGQDPLVAGLMALVGLNPRYTSAANAVRTTTLGSGGNGGVSRQGASGGGGGGTVSRQGGGSAPVSRQGGGSASGTPAPVSRQ